MTRTLIVAVALLLTPCVAAAQLPPLGDVFTAIERAAAEAGIARTAPAASTALTQYLAIVRRAGLAKADLSRGCAERSTIRPATLARQRQSLWDFGLDDATLEARNAMIGVWQVTNTAIIPRLSRERGEALLQPFFEVSQCLRRAATAQDLERLRRFEIKFGPGSPQLNGLEVAANYIAQRAPLFGPTKDGFPGPLELVGSYAPTYIFYTDKPRAASAAEFGLRLYDFSAGSDSTSRGGTMSAIRGLVHPRYWALGVAVLNEREETLAWPWQGNASTGPFINWGPIRIAYIVEGRNRLLVSRNLQLIPLVF